MSAHLVAAGITNNTGASQFRDTRTAGNNTYNNIPPNGLLRFTVGATAGLAIINNSARATPPSSPAPAAACSS